MDFIFKCKMKEDQLEHSQGTALRLKTNCVIWKYNPYQRMLTENDLIYKLAYRNKPRYFLVFPSKQLLEIIQLKYESVMEHVGHAKNSFLTNIKR